MAYNIVRASDLVGRYDKKVYANFVEDFLCPYDLDIEFFLKEKSYQFEKMGISRTYLVYTSYKSNPVLVGYFALTIKPLDIRKGISKTQLRKLAGFSNEKEKVILS